MNIKIAKKLQNIKLLILDVDGVLTDGSLYYSDTGVETKSFYVPDGIGIKLLLANKIEVAVISGRKSTATKNRMHELGVKYIYLGKADKVQSLNHLKKKLHLKNENIAFIGDDLPDMPIMQQVGFRIAVPNAYPKILAMADWIVKAKGGKGAVREACELILNSIK